MFRLREIWEESCGPGPARRFNFRLRADRSSLWGRIPSTVWSSLRHSCWCPKQSKDPSQSKSRAKTVPKLSTTDTEQARSRDGLLIGANGRSLLVLIKSSDFQLVILGLPLMGAMFGLCLGGPVGLLAGVTRTSQTCVFVSFPLAILWSPIAGETWRCCSSWWLHPWLRRCKCCQGTEGAPHLHRRALRPWTRPLCSQPQRRGWANSKAWSSSTSWAIKASSSEQTRVQARSRRISKTLNSLDLLLGSVIFSSAKKGWIFPKSRGAISLDHTLHFLKFAQVRSRRDSMNAKHTETLPPHLARPSFRRLGDLPEAEQKSVTVFIFFRWVTWLKLLKVMALICSAEVITVVADELPAQSRWIQNPNQSQAKDKLETFLSPRLPDRKRSGTSSRRWNFKTNQAKNYFSWFWKILYLLIFKTQLTFNSRVRTSSLPDVLEEDSISLLSK